MDMFDSPLTQGPQVRPVANTRLSSAQMFPLTTELRATHAEGATEGASHELLMRFHDIKSQ